jgi:hypothetical protein
VWKLRSNKGKGEVSNNKGVEQKTEYMCEYPSKNGGRKIMKALANI